MKKIHLVTGIDEELGRGRPGEDQLGVKGHVLLELRGPDGVLKDQREVSNLVTDAGDLYIAQMGIALTGTPNAAQPTKAGSMKLGTGTTAVAKNGAGASIVSYISGSAQAFDSAYPQTNNLGAGLGVQMVWKVTYAAGTATNTAITEAVISTGAADSNAGTHFSRVVFTAINKGASDSLAITWSWKILGS